MNEPLSRRTLLKSTGTAAVLASGGAGLLAGCGGKKSKNTVAANTKVKLPTYVPYTGGAKPDLPGTEQGVQPAFFRYPTNPKAATSEKPGSGSSVSAFANIYYAIPPGPGRNKFWSSLNEQLGVDLKLQMVPNGDYATKFPTIIAGNDLPDLLQVIGTPAPNMPQLLASKFTDLTDYLSGDAVKEYPYLANIPERGWKTTIYNGGIYGIPVPREAIGGYNFAREDLFKKAGASLTPKNFNEFHDGAKALNNPRKHQWTFGSADAVISLVNTMQNAPNGWRDNGGKLTNNIETDEYRKSLSTAIQFWKEGLIHPDAFEDAPPIKEWFVAGTICVDPTGYAGWAQYIQQGLAHPGFQLNLLTAPGYDGGLGKIPLGGPSFSTTAIKKASKSRVKELLRIANWLATPFGSKEYLFRVYGITGVDNTVDKNGDPHYTQLGLSEAVPLPIRYVADAPAPIYQPSRPQDAKIQHAYQSKVLPDGIPNPTLGLFSDTNAQQGAIINKAFANAHNDIIQGRKPLSALDDALKAWRQGGGDKIRKEYEDQLQKQGGS
ncbi:MAG TPA: extracellular solute-binding protein [Mycobacteriales bacterium]|jgi:putative aldouronate transport system substrate-binding protein|nr:extracellular solute-binding protein [Mycobacteriales bacterium]